MELTAARPKLQVRRPPLAFSDALPRHWAGGSILATHLINGVNLLFPVGERFFVRSVRRYLDRYRDDPERTAEIRGFFGQEGRHARAHEQYFEILRAQGYEIDEFLARFERVFAALERVMPDVLNLAGTAAGEHFTAIMANDAFADEGFFQSMPEVMRELLLWHAAEEIEHKAVAFDVLKDVDDRYAVRVLGMLVASAFLAVWWALAVRMLLKQDGVDFATVRAEMRALRASGDDSSIARDVFLAGIRSYLRRDFHPWQEAAPPAALEWIARLDAAPTAPSM